MIHVYDQDFQHKVSDTFHEAYMTHTSTSPNYQILASLDVGRRQVELEGFELVKKQVEMAMVLREKVLTHPLLSRYFRFLTVKDMIPAGIPQERHRVVLRAREGLDRLLRGVAHRRVRARPEPADPRGRPDRRRRQHVQERLPDEQVRHPDQQDLAQHRAVHDQHRHDAQLGRLPDRRAGADRQGARGRPRGFQPGRAGGARAAGPQPDPRPARPARLQPLPRPLPPRPAAPARPRAITRDAFFLAYDEDGLRVPAAPGRHHRRADGRRAARSSRRSSSFPIRPASRSWCPGRC